MELWIFLTIAVVFVVLVIGQVAARRMASTHDGRLAWVSEAPRFIAPVVLVWGGAKLISGGEFAGVPLILIGVVVFAVFTHLVANLSRHISGTPKDQELGPAIEEPAIDLVVVGVMVPLIIGVVVLVGLIVWGVVHLG